MMRLICGQPEKIMDKLPFNWFDMFLVIFVIVGGFMGRKRGMSQELMPLLKWILIVVGCALVYKPVAELIASTWFSMLFSSYAAYLILAAIVATLMSVVNRSLGGKIVGSDLFGKGEYYLGIVAGSLRFACILIFGLALLNARLFTSQEIEERRLFVQKNYDSDFFPALYQIQDAVFRYSMTGPHLHQHLNFLLIKPVVAEKKGLKRNEFELPM